MIQVNLYTGNYSDKLYKNFIDASCQDNLIPVMLFDIQLLPVLGQKHDSKLQFNFTVKAEVFVDLQPMFC